MYQSTDPPILKTWRDDGTSVTVCMERAVTSLVGGGYYRNPAAVRQSLLDGETLATHFAYYKVDPYATRF